MSKRADCSESRSNSPPPRAWLAAAGAFFAAGFLSPAASPRRDFRSFAMALETLRSHAVRQAPADPRIGGRDPGNLVDTGLARGYRLSRRIGQQRQMARSFDGDR